MENHYLGDNWCVVLLLQMLISTTFYWQNKRVTEWYAGLYDHSIFHFFLLLKELTGENQPANCILPDWFIPTPDGYMVYYTHLLILKQLECMDVPAEPNTQIWIMSSCSTFHKEFSMSSIWTCLCEPGDGESRSFVQNSRESSGGLLLGPVGRTHAKTLLSHARCGTRTGMSRGTAVLEYIHDQAGWITKQMSAVGQVPAAMCSVLPQP